MRGVERGQEREAIVDEFASVSDKQLSSLGHDRAKPGELVVVAVGYLENRETPEAPSVVTLLD